MAVTTTVHPKGGGHRKPLIALYANYLAVLERLGVTGVLLTPEHGDESVDRLLQHCSGLMLTGGEDVEPSRYGEEPIPELGTVNPRRDAMEFHALERALARELPVLAICRGCQLANVYFGGTLYQDVDAQCPQVLTHYQPAPWGEHQHDVRVEPGSRLCRILDTDTIQINSFHHQAIKDIAPVLHKTAVADDGMIEAVESTEHDWLLGVQWHPERHEAKATLVDDPNLKVLQAFAEAAMAFDARHRSPTADRQRSSTAF